MSNTITCPSGLVGRIRGMKAREPVVVSSTLFRIAASSKTLSDNTFSVNYVAYFSRM